MYVYRPQQVQSHVPGRSAHSGPARVGCLRQKAAGKAQRRAQAKPRRPQLPARRRRPQLADAAFPRRQAEPAAGAASSEGEPAGGPSDGGAPVRARLRARVVERRAAEVAAALAWRHGSQWAALALRGDFHANEVIQRQCEAFGLRPDLERRVLQAVRERARGRADLADGGTLEKHAADAPPFGPETPLASPRPVPLLPTLTTVLPGLEAEADLLDPESDQGFLSSPWGSHPASPAASSAASPVVSPQLPARAPGPLAPLEPAEDPECSSDGGAPVGGPAPWRAAAGAPAWRPPWRERVARALGIQRWWSGSSGSESEPAAAAGAPRPRRRASKEALSGSGGEEAPAEAEEERLLGAQLAAAAANAERHAASSRSARGGRSALRAAEEALASGGAWPAEASRSQPTPRARGSALARRHEACCAGAGARRRVARFAEESRVRFFPAEDASAHHPPYERELQTKAFDGPSGHKAKRGELRLWNPASGEDGSEELDDSEEEDDEESFEEGCDAIAELMGSQRSMLLWAASW